VKVEIVVEDLSSNFRLSFYFQEVNILAAFVYKLSLAFAAKDYC
jgi:hypothetical protein